MKSALSAAVRMGLPILTLAGIALALTSAGGVAYGNVVAYWKLDGDTSDATGNFADGALTATGIDNGDGTWSETWFGVPEGAYVLTAVVTATSSYTDMERA